MKLSKMTLLLGGLLALVPSFGHAVEVIGARINGAQQTLELNVVTDCNSVSPMMQYDYSNKRIDGPHYYTVSLLSTMMGCPKSILRVRKLYVPLPRLRVGQSVNIRVDNQTLRYVTSVPQPDQEFDINNGGRYPNENDLLAPTDPYPKTPHDDSLFMDPDATFR